MARLDGLGESVLDARICGNMLPLVVVVLAGAWPAWAETLTITEHRITGTEAPGDERIEVEKYFIRLAGDFCCKEYGRALWILYIILFAAAACLSLLPRLL